MQILPTVLPTALFLCVAGGGAAACVGLADGDGDPRDFASRAKISLRDAVAAALEARPGRAVEAELEMEDEEDGARRLVYSIDVVTEDGLYDVDVDPTSGAVLSNEREDDEDDELRAYREVLRHAEKSLVDLADSAGSLIRGQVVSAEFELDDGQPVAEVLLVNGRYLIEAAVEARAGHVVELELEGALGWEDDGDDEGADEDDDDHEEDGAGDEDDDGGEHDRDDR
jgi:uncharacterized membrane protein YkoI